MICYDVLRLSKIQCTHTSSAFPPDLIGTLDTNTTIQDITLEGNQIDLGILDEINAILDQRRQPMPSRASSPNLEATVRSVTKNDPNLVEVRLDGMKLAQSHEAEELIDALATNTVVTKISLDNTGIDDSLIAALSLSLVDNRSVTEISLRNNQITSEGCEYVSILCVFCFLIVFL